MSDYGDWPRDDETPPAPVCALVLVPLGEPVGEDVGEAVGERVMVRVELAMRVEVVIDRGGAP